MNDEDVLNLKKAIQKAIDDYFSEQGVDSSYYEFDIIAYEFEEDFTSLSDRRKIIEAGHPCAYCGRQTFRHIQKEHERGMYVCASCEGKREAGCGI